MAWNVKYGACRVDFWFDFWGDRVQLSSTEVNDCLSKIAALVREYDPDVLITEEIEVGSKRSAYVDMVQYLLENTNLRYGRLRRHVGLALRAQRRRRPHQPRQRDSQPLPHREGRAHSPGRPHGPGPADATFYLKRGVARAELDLGSGRTVAIYGVHTEAYDQDGTKQKQIKQLYELLAKAETLPWMIGGDFNELPPVCDERADAGTPESCEGKLRLTGFLDERASAKGTSFEQPPYTPSVMKKFYDDFAPSITLARYGVGEEAQRRYFTHSVLGPDGRTTRAWPALEPNARLPLHSQDRHLARHRRHSGARALRHHARRASLSDHAPVVGTWELR
jgi:endonuclease/exonuclease/phosphatase family metal-dependent hydrolase